MDIFKIYIDRLAKKDYAFDVEVEPSELDIVQEDELKFSSLIKINLKAYLADKDLILNCNIDFTIHKPCKICNETSNKAISIKNYYITKEISSIDAIYDVKEEIRNLCFLEIPVFVECMDKCEERKNLKKYFKENESEKENNNYPFSDL